MEKKIALFPGSFDPITLGHFDIIKKALPLFDKIIIAIGKNDQKKYMFSLSERKKWIQNCFACESKIEIATYSGLTVEFCEEKKAQFILRGLRNPSDFEFEKAICYTNRKLSENKIETLFLLTSSKYSYISSSIVRDVITNKGDYSLLTPIEAKIKTK
jgi:pantetheine-phosphate adenylyltransferase